MHTFLTYLTTYLAKTTKAVIECSSSKFDCLKPTFLEPLSNTFETCKIKSHLQDQDHTLQNWSSLSKLILLKYRREAEKFDKKLVTDGSTGCRLLPIRRRKSNWVVIVPPVTPNPSYQISSPAPKLKFQNMRIFCSILSPYFLYVFPFFTTFLSSCPFFELRLSKYLHSSSYLFDQVSNI